MNRACIQKYFVTGLAVLVGTVLFVRFLLPILLPFGIGLLLALAAEPAIRFLMRRAGFRRGIAAALCILALYVLLGTNSLVSADEQKEQSFLAYYERMLQMLKETAPGAVIYVQSIPPVRPEITTLNNDQIRRVNEQLALLARAQDCYYLNLHEFLADENGDLKSELAAQDGIHLNGTGYKQWVDYISRHVAYSDDLPFLYGSPYASKTTSTAAGDATSDSGDPAAGAA